MGISQFKLEPEIDPRVVAAIIAAVLHHYQSGEEKELLVENAYISKKNHGWKNLGFQENCWGLSRFRY